MVIFNRLRSSNFIRQVSTVALGSLGAQIIALLGTPIITRLYSPNDFALLALITAVASIFAPIAAGRYETAVVVAKKNSEVINQKLTSRACFSFGRVRLYTCNRPCVGKSLSIT